MPRGNVKNLIPNSQRTPEQLKEQTRQGGIASGEARRAKKSITECLKILMEQDHKINIDGKAELKTGAEITALSLFKQVGKGNINAIKEALDRLDGAVKQKTELSGQIDGDNKLTIEFVNNENKNT